MESSGTIEFGDLANVAEVVRGPFVEHLFEVDQAELGMLCGACADIGRKRSQELDEFSPGMSETRQVFLR